MSKRFERALNVQVGAFQSRSCETETLATETVVGLVSSYKTATRRTKQGKGGDEPVN